MTNITYAKGDITLVKTGVILHQVNTAGVMGAGVARSLADTFKNLEAPYAAFCHQFRKMSDYGGLYAWTQLRGEVQFAPVATDLMVANIFSQSPAPNKGVLTDYHALRKALRRISFSVSPDVEVHIPNGMSCGIANGDWRIVSKIIEDELRPFKKVTIWTYTPPSMIVSQGLPITKQGVRPQTK